MKKRKFGFAKIVRDFLSAFNVERGFIPTVKDLLLRPETVMHHYIEGKELLKIYKEKYFLPGRFFVTVFAVMAIFSLLIGDSMFNPSFDSSTGYLNSGGSEDRILNLMDQYAMFVVFLIGIVPATMATKILFFKKRNYNLAMHFIINIYLQCMILLFTPIYFLFVDTQEQYITISMLMYTLYYTYALKRIFNTSWPTGILKGVLLQIIGISMILIVAVLFGLLYVLIMKGGFPETITIK